MNASEIKLSTPTVAPFTTSVPLSILASGQINIESGQNDTAAIFLRANTGTGEFFSIIGENAAVPTYPQKGFLFEMAIPAVFSIADATYVSDHGDNPILLIDYASGTPTYHIRTGATWVADL